MPSASNAMVCFFSCVVALNSTVELGRWLEITHRLQNTTCAGRPYLASSDMQELRSVQRAIRLQPLGGTLEALFELDPRLPIELGARQRGVALQHQHLAGVGAHATRVFFHRGANAERAAGGVEQLANAHR